MNLATLAERSRDAFGTFDFLIFEGKHYSNEDMVRLSRQSANAMWTLGLKPGERVLVLLPNCPQVLTAYLGLLRLGAIVVPVNGSIGPLELGHIIRDSKPAAVITSERFLSLINGVAKSAGGFRHIVLIDNPNLKNTLSFDDLIAGVSETFDTPETADDEVAVVLYTAGTTGTPKGVMLTHGNLYSNAEAASRLADNPGQKALGVLPLSHCYGFTVMNTSFLTRTTVVLMRAYDTEQAFKLIEKHRISQLSAVPTILHMMLTHPDADKYDLGSLETVGCGAAPLPPELLQAFIRRFHCEVREGYGLSEAAPIVSAHRPGRPIKPGSVGEPLPGISVRIVDKEAKDLPVGEIGELWVRGPNVMKGYYGLPEDSAEALRDGWLHTGDMTRQDADGYLYLVERKKDLILRGGFNIYPREVEQVIIQHPAVLEVAVIGVPDAVFGEEVAAVVVVKEGERLTEKELINFCQARLAKNTSPRHVHFVSELPKNALGKMMRKELRKRFGEGSTVYSIG
ncbi:MAG: long-chain-fatty-acid--CoA ligase [Gammaproteobacteria bacterium]